MTSLLSIFWLGFSHQQKEYSKGWSELTRGRCPVCALKEQASTHIGSYGKRGCLTYKIHKKRHLRYPVQPSFQLQALLSFPGKLSPQACHPACMAFCLTSGLLHPPRRPVDKENLGRRFLRLVPLVLPLSAWGCTSQKWGVSLLSESAM